MGRSLKVVLLKMQLLLIALLSKIQEFLVDCQDVGGTDCGLVNSYTISAARNTALDMVSIELHITASIN